MHTRVYIDTNVLLDIFDKKRPFHRFSVNVVQTCFENKDIELFINSDTLSNNPKDFKNSSIDVITSKE
ncbi:MAG: hypothetical protein ACLFQJ_07305, partial [Campylobacterales bacterium]